MWNPYVTQVAQYKNGQFRIQGSHYVEVSLGMAHISDHISFTLQITVTPVMIKHEVNNIIKELHTHLLMQGSFISLEHWTY